MEKIPFEGRGLSAVSEEIECQVCIGKVCVSKGYIARALDHQTVLWMVEGGVTS